MAAFPLSLVIYLFILIVAKPNQHQLENDKIDIQNALIEILKGAVQNSRHQPPPKDVVVVANEPISWFEVTFLFKIRDH